MVGCRGGGEEASSEWHGGLPPPHKGMAAPPWPGALRASSCASPALTRLLWHAAERWHLPPLQICGAWV